MSEILRTIRQWSTARAVRAGRRAAPCLPLALIDAMEYLLARAGPAAPVLGRTVAGNMRSAGLYSREAHRAYFARAAQHLAGLLLAFRQYRRRTTSGSQRMPDALARIVEERVGLDESIDRLRAAHAQARGVVLMGVHATHFMLVLARINQELPVTVYLRHSRDASKQTAKRQWCELTGLQYIAEPPSVTNPLRRAEIMADALRDGRILVITPDLVQKRSDGVPVRFLGREVYLPAGPAALSLLVEAPLLTVMARPAGPRAIRLAFHGPASPDVNRGRKGWRQEATRERLQWFADILVEELLRPHPELWFLWGDKRWTRVFRGDSRYTRPLT